MSLAPSARAVLLAALLETPISPLAVRRSLYAALPTPSATAALTDASYACGAYGGVVTLRLAGGGGGGATSAAGGGGASFNVTFYCDAALPIRLGVRAGSRWDPGAAGLSSPGTIAPEWNEMRCGRS